MDNESRFYCEIERQNGIAIMSIGNYILDPEEMLEIAQEITNTVANYRDAIEEWNRYAHTLERKIIREKTKTYPCVYLLKCGDSYKIGVSKNISRRVAELDKRPFKIEIVAVSQPLESAYAEEKRLKATFNHAKIGGEWFKLNEEDAFSAAEEIRLLGVEYE